MKYGLLVYKGVHGGNVGRKEKGTFNVGDNIQMFAMQQIYNKMGIPPEEIIKIDYHDLGTYAGEYVILPINFFFFGCSNAREKFFPTSSRIMPVFIGVHLETDCFNLDEIRYLKENGPIGCRDEYTLSNLRKYGIPSYLFGCVSATLDKRKKESTQLKTYIVDVEDKVIDYMPEELKKNVCRVYHEEHEYFSQETFDKMDLKAETILQEYKKNAALVVTSRLHCASPCIAMGIPTIIIVKEKSSRFAWLDKLVTLYSVDELEKVDWFPEPIDYEHIKEKMIGLIIERIRNKKNEWEKICDISYYFEDRKKEVYVNPYDNFVKKLRQEIVSKNNKEYIIWGATALAEYVYQYMNENCSDTKLVAVIDTYNDVVFHEIKTQKPDILKNYQDVAMIVTPSLSKESIKHILKKYFYKGDCIFCDGEKFVY